MTLFDVKTAGRDDVVPRLAADVPPFSGKVKVEPEDFVVEEIPAYEPSGEGEHLFLWIEKRDLSGERLIAHVAKKLGVNRDDIGTAGIKDRRAVTRQYLSVPAEFDGELESLNEDGVTLLSSSRHRNKLRTGHLAGNKFDLLIRETPEGAIERAEAIASMIRQTGFPNLYGDQRFGNQGETLKLGLDLLNGVKRSSDIPRARRRFLMRLSISAVQSVLFNKVLAERMQDGLLATVLAGDVLQKRRTGGLFVAENVETEQARMQQGEVSLTGPMFGPKMLAPTGIAAGRESRVLEWIGLTRDAFTTYRDLSSGTRRPLTVIVPDLVVLTDPLGVRLQFTLPSGAYATSLLKEFLTSGPQTNATDDESPPPAE
ncbi:MAG: tRNA pseudouridine(13) synthase TruD [Planctomycetaceae bacterium]